MHDMIAGNVRIAGVDVAFVDQPSGEGRSHWVLGVDDAGVRIAVPPSDGPLVPCDGPPSEDAIREVLEALVADPPGATDAQVLATVLVPFGPQALAWQAGAEVEFLRRAAVDAACEPLRERLGARLALLEAYREIGNRGGVPREGRIPSPVEVEARILRLDEEELANLRELRRSGSGWNLALEIEGLDLHGDRQALRGRFLSALGMPEAAARRVPEGIPLSPDLLRLLRVLPVDWVPDAGSGEWRHLIRVARMVAGTGRPDAEWLPLLLGAKGRWEEFSDRCIGRLVDGGLADYELVAEHAGNLVLLALDMNRAFETFLETVAACEGIPSRLGLRDLAREALEGNRSLPAILENAVAWHRDYSEVAQYGIGWEPILPSWVDPRSGIEIVALRSSDELVEEGDTERGLDHCVGNASFALGCLRDEIRILSLRRQGKRLSTAEVRLGKPPGKVDPVTQHAGRGNAVPGDDERRALSSYMALPEVVAPRLAARPNERDLPPHDPSTIPERLDRWRPFLVGRWRKAAAGDLVEAVRALSEFDASALRPLV